MWSDQRKSSNAATVPVYVLTHHPGEAVTDFGVTFYFVTAGLEAAIRQAAAAAGDKNVMLFGASIAQQCLRAGLADEIHSRLSPILLGKGICLSATWIFTSLSWRECRLSSLQR